MPAKGQRVVLFFYRQLKLAADGKQAWLLRFRRTGMGGYLILRP